MAVAATLVADDLIQTAGCDPTAVHANLDAFATRLSARGVGLATDWMPTATPRYAPVGAPSGVLARRLQVVKHARRFLEQLDFEGQLEQGFFGLG